jgi:hypothetical protein
MSAGNMSVAFKHAAEIVTGYTEHSCYDCGKTHSVPPWFKPFKDYCDDCRQEQIEQFAGLDKEPEIEETEDEQI